MIYISFISGLAILVLCGDTLVRGAVALAVRFSIPMLVIGLTIVAFGTSAPELVVSLRAALIGAPGITIGNIIGSNIANVLLVLGIPAIIYATNCNQPFIRRNTLFVIFASVVFIILCFNGPLAFWHGALLFALMVVFLVDSGVRAASNEEAAKDITDDTLEFLQCSAGKCLSTKPFLIAGYMLIGLLGLPLGAYLTVEGATGIAREFGISEAVIGLTIVAMGTSLPELVTTVMAALRRQCGLALGNVLGSNLFNILAIMGLTSMVTPIPVPQEFLRVDLWMMLFATLIITPFVLQRMCISRMAGMTFVLFYAAYIYYSLDPSYATKNLKTNAVKTPIEAGLIDQ
ncbi:MAG: calcium/sodium antiporter [Pseudomonadota bacterium]